LKLTVLHISLARNEVNSTTMHSSALAEPLNSCLEFEAEAAGCWITNAKQMPRHSRNMCDTLMTYCA